MGDTSLVNAAMGHVTGLFSTEQQIQCFGRVVAMTKERILRPPTKGWSEEFWS